MIRKIHEQHLVKEMHFKRKLLAVLCSLSISAGAFAQAKNDSDVSEDEQVEEVIVTGRQQALQNAAELKRNAESSIDSIVADDAGMLPDASITEVLQRISGVSIVRFSSLGNPDAFSAEGSGVQVRGLSGVAGRVNGREVFSANSGRGLSWGDVTPELMAGVDVYKSSTADQIEGGTGGSIDLRTKMPFDYDGNFNADVTASLNYGDLSEEASPSGSVLVTDRWETSLGEFGALLNLASSEFYSRSDFIRMEPFYRTNVNGTDRFIPGGYDYGVTSFERDRQGAYLGLQWSPSEELMISQTVFYSDYTEQSTSQGLFVVARDRSDGNGFSVDPSVSEFDSNGVLLRTDNMFLRDRATFNPSGDASITAGGNSGIAEGTSDTLDLSTTFKWDVSDSWTIKGAFQKVDSSSTRDTYDVFPGTPFPAAFGLDLTGKLPKITLPASAAEGFRDPSRYTWDATMDHKEENQGDMTATNIDFNYVISEEGFFRSTQFGARYADRTENDDNSGYQWSALGRGWNGSPQLTFADAREGDVEEKIFENFFRGNAQLPANTLMPSYEMVSKLDPVGDHTFYGGLPREPIGFNEQGFDSLSQSTVNTALYGLVRFASESGVGGWPLSGNVGVRYVELENESRGFFQQNAASFLNGDVPTIIPLIADERRDGATFDKLLPSLNFRLDPLEDLQVRLSYNLTLDQPSFSALRATGNVSAVLVQEQDPANPGDPDARITRLTGFTTNTGNPKLLPVISKNTDLSFEWYPSDLTSAHLSFFHKSIDNWFIYGNANVPVPVTYSLPTQETIMEIASKDDVYNATESATVKGFEIAATTFFKNLPAPWDGFGISANYTYIDSKNPGDRYFDIDGVERADAPLQGLSENNMNFQLMYEKGPMSLRVAYSWRDKYLMSTNSNGTNGDYWYYSAPNVGEVVDISLPIYGGDYGQVDLGGTYRVTDNFTVSLQLNNLTDEVARTWQGGYPGDSKLARSWFLTDRRAEFIVRYNF